MVKVFFCQETLLQQPLWPHFWVLPCLRKKENSNETIAGNFQTLCSMSMSLSHLNTLGRKKHDKSQKKSFSRKLAFTFWGRELLSENWPRKTCVQYFVVGGFVSNTSDMYSCVLHSFLAFLFSRVLYWKDKAKKKNHQYFVLFQLRIHMNWHFVRYIACFLLHAQCLKIK